MFRWLLGSVFLLAVAGGSAMGCNSGLSTTDAKLRCQEEQQSKGECVTAKAYQQCISCVEMCGDQCQPEAQCPEVYSCNDMTPSQ